MALTEDKEVAEGGVITGAPVRRREDPRFLRGSGRYVDDLGATSDVYAFFVRSPYAHAKVLSVDAADALKMVGVRTVITGLDLLESGVSTIPAGWIATNRDGTPMAAPQRYPLCIDKVRHVGDPVAAVIADSLEQAKDAAELVEIRYEDLPSTADMSEATCSTASQIWDEAPNNICLDWELGDRLSTGKALEAAAHVVELELHNNRLAANPMEPRTVRAFRDPATGRHTLLTSSQCPHTIRTLCASALGISEADLRVIAPDVGGGFGTKMFLYPEEVVVTWAAGRLNMPVKWTAERSESFLTDAQGRDHRTLARLALDKDGSFLALWVDTDANVGAYLSQAASAIPTYYYASLLSGVYTIPNIYCNVRLVFTNTTAVDAYRGAGRPEASYVLERIVDEAARQLNVDRVALRRQNFISAASFPYATATGLVYDSGDHEATLGIALNKINYEGFPERRLESERAGKLRGIGFSTYVEIAGGLSTKDSAQLGWKGGRYEAAEIRVHPSGLVTVFCGSHSQGQGHETVYAQLVCEKLGVPYENVNIVQGDTDQLVHGRGAYASRSLVVGGSAILRAADKIIQKATCIASLIFEVDPEDVSFERGVFLVLGTNHALSFEDIARKAYAAAEYSTELIEPGLNEIAFYDSLNWTFPGGCHACEVEVDPETGFVQLLRVVAVDDVGKVINPLVVEGQIHGGLAQGIGQALYEHVIYDSETSQPLTGSFMDYAMPRADCLPQLEVFTHETLCIHNELGAKGCGEVGSVGVPPAVVNAIVDALRPYGVRHVEMPATPFRIWEAIYRKTTDGCGASTR